MEGSERWKRLHPASVVVNLLPTAWRAMRSLWPLLLAVLWGGRGQQIGTFELSLLLFFFGTPIWRTVWHWLTLRYRVHEGRLEIQSGLLYRQARVIPPERIQNVELVRNVFHRLSGLVELKVETASGTEVEGMLSALSVTEAESLMEALDAARQRVRPDPTEEVDSIPLVQNSPLDLLRYGLSTGRMGLAVVALGFLYEAVVSLDPTRGAQNVASILGTAGSLAILVAVVLGAWIAGATTSIVRHWGFRLLKSPGSLIAEEGLFTRRRVELSERKVQLVTLQQSLIRRALGFGTLQLETAAVREESGGTQTAEAVVPVLPDADIARVLRSTLPDAPDLDTLSLQPPHKKALLRALLASFFSWTLLSSLVTWLFYPTGAIAFVLLPASLFSTWFDYRHQGWWVGQKHIVSRTGWFNRKTRIVAREKLQSLELIQGPLARQWNLAQLRVRVAGSSVALPVLSFDDAIDLLTELSATIEKPGAPYRSVVASGEDGPSMLVLLDDHQDRAGDQDPGDGLGNRTEHQRQGVDQNPSSSTAISPIADPPGEGEQAQADDDPRVGEHDLAHGGDLPVEPGLPEVVDPGLQEHHQALDRDQASEGDMHGRYDDPHNKP